MTATQTIGIPESVEDFEPIQSVLNAFEYRGTPMFLGALRALAQQGSPEAQKIASYEIAMQLFSSGHFAEAQREIEKIVQQEEKTTGYGKTLLLAANIRLGQGKSDTVERYITKAVEIFRQNGDWQAYGEALQVYAAYQALVGESSQITKELISTGKQFEVAFSRAPGEWQGQSVQRAGQLAFGMSSQ